MTYLIFFKLACKEKTGSIPFLYHSCAKQGLKFNTIYTCFAYRGGSPPLLSGRPRVAAVVGLERWPLEGELSSSHSIIKQYYIYSITLYQK